VSALDEFEAALSRPKSRLILDTNVLLALILVRTGRSVSDWPEACLGYDGSLVETIVVSAADKAASLTTTTYVLAEADYFCRERSQHPHDLVASLDAFIVEVKEHLIPAKSIAPWRLMAPGLGLADLGLQPAADSTALVLSDDMALINFLYANGVQAFSLESLIYALQHGG
jgi:hypothetical protein